MKITAKEKALILERRKVKGEEELDLKDFLSMCKKVGDILAGDIVTNVEEFFDNNEDALLEYDKFAHKATENGLVAINEAWRIFSLLSKKKYKEAHKIALSLRKAIK